MRQIKHQLRESKNRLRESKNRLTAVIGERATIWLPFRSKDSLKIRTIRAVQLDVSSRVRTEYVIDQVNIDGSDETEGQGPSYQPTVGNEISEG